MAVDYLMHPHNDTLTTHHIRYKKITVLTKKIYSLSLCSSIE